MRWWSWRWGEWWVWVYECWHWTEKIVYQGQYITKYIDDNFTFVHISSVVAVHNWSRLPSGPSYKSSSSALVPLHEGLNRYSLAIFGTYLLNNNNLFYIFIFSCLLSSSTRQLWTKVQIHPFIHEFIITYCLRHCVSMSAWFCPTTLAKFWRPVGCTKKGSFLISATWFDPCHIPIHDPDNFP